MFAKRAVIVCLLSLALAGGAWGRGRAHGGRPPVEGKVRFVIDGDTIVLETGEKVRYAGIDAPEIGHHGEPSECYGQKARRANAKMVLGTKVTLRYGRRIRDYYGRLLALVYAPDGTCVNLELIKSGNAHVYRDHESARFYSTFLAAQREAIRERRGQWGACRVKPEPYYSANSGSRVFHRPGCRRAREISAADRVKFSDRWSALNDGYRPCRLCKP
jgi:micrococcal nuclease